MLEEDSWREIFYGLSFLPFPRSDNFFSSRKRGRAEEQLLLLPLSSTLDIPLSIPSDTAQAAEHARQGPPVCARMLTQVNGFMTMSVAFISYIPKENLMCPRDHW